MNAYLCCRIEQILKCGYFLGTFILANTVIGWVAQQFGWSWTFLLLVAACLLAILFMGLTLKEERRS